MLALGQGRRLATRSPVHGPLVVGGILLLLAVAYWPSVVELSGFGSRTDGQFLIVFCAFAGLVWGRRHILEALPLRPFWPALTGLLLLALGWLVGQLAFIRILADASVILMVPMTILAIGGLQWAAALAFPLAFLVFAIPLDQFLAPPLAEWTAQVAIFLLQAVGVPVEREGAYFTVPTGKWVVADACAGVQYLASCLIVAVLLAPALFYSTRKRAAFVFGAVMLAIVGNWLRAFLTVWGAHLTNNEWLRDDHSTFGWLLYAGLFVLYCLAWWRFRDDDPHRGRLLFADRGELQPQPDASMARVAAVTILALAIVLGAPVVSKGVSARESAQPAAKPHVREAHGWRQASAPATDWKPLLPISANVVRQSFEKEGRAVDLFIGTFHQESWDAKLVSVANSLVAPGDPSWALANRGVAVTERGHSVSRALIQGLNTQVIAWQWYWVSGASTHSGVEAKLLQLRSRLTTGRQQSAWIALSADSDAHLQAFVREMGQGLNQALMERE